MAYSGDKGFEFFDGAVEAHRDEVFAFVEGVGNFFDAVVVYIV